MDSRLPPQNLDAEQSVLGGILIDNQAFHKVIETLTPDDFYRPANGKIFGAMCELAAKGEPIDVVTLTAKMKALEVYEEIGGAAYLAELLERVPTAVNSEYHASLGRRPGGKTDVWSSTCNEIFTSRPPAWRNNRGVTRLRGKIRLRADVHQALQNMLPIRDIVRGAFLELEKRYENQDQMTGVATGYIELDKMTSGFQRSDLIIVACRPSMGKTSFFPGCNASCCDPRQMPSSLFLSKCRKNRLCSACLPPRLRWTPLAFEPAS